MRSINLALVSAFTALAVTSALAQAPAPVRLRGTIDSVNGSTLNVTARDGAKATVKLAENATVVGVAKASLSDVKQGGFVGITAMPQPDGTQKAVEIHIFPEAMRGTGEGHRPMGPNPNRSMTNGTVAMNDPEARTMTNGTVSAASGMGSVTLTVHYKEGDQMIEVAPDTPVVTIIPGDRTLLKPGATVSVVAAQKDSGLTATILTAEKDGVKPI